jgi:hypothetical protein
LPKAAVLARPDDGEADGDPAAALVAAEAELAAAGTTLLGTLLAGEADFRPGSHYPPGEVADFRTGSQWYYHRHEADVGGHFHLFQRVGRRGAGAGFVHLAGVALDARGEPVELFVTGRRATGEEPRGAAVASRLLARFAVTHDWPARATNAWLGALVRLYRPEIEALHRERDATAAAGGGGLGVLGRRPIALRERLAGLEGGAGRAY